MAEQITEQQLKDRTKQPALEAIRLGGLLPRTDAGHVLGRQFMRSGTSVGANYRAACRARSTDEFVAKLGVVEEEADESLFWLDLIVDSEMLTTRSAAKFREECEAILRIVVSSIKTARGKKRQQLDVKGCHAQVADTGPCPKSASSVSGHPDNPKSKTQNPKWK